MPAFLSDNPLLMKEEIFSDYLNWMRSIDPNLLPNEKKDIVSKVKQELGIDKLVTNCSDLNFDKLIHLSKGNQLIENLGIYLGTSLSFLCPPVTTCILCKKLLTKNNQPSQVVVHTTDGPKMYSKYIYRCRQCKVSKKDKLQPQDVYYHPDKVIYH